MFSAASDTAAFPFLSCAHSTGNATSGRVDRASFLPASPGTIDKAGQERHHDAATTDAGIPDTRTL